MHAKSVDDLLYRQIDKIAKGDHIPYRDYVALEAYGTELIAKVNRITQKQAVSRFREWFRVTGYRLEG